MGRNASDDAAREDLAKRLPGLRSSGCPEGSDEAILAMSSPKAHTACPNPYIEEWLNSLPPRDDSNRPDPGPFTQDVAGKKTSPIYKAHSYPTKVPPEIILRQILHYTRPGDVVLDGFAGTGMTGVAAQMAAHPTPELRNEIELEAQRDGRQVQWGPRYAILNDLAPGATFIAAGLNLPVDAHAFDQASRALLERFDREYGWMYETTVQGRPAQIDYTIWSEVFTCPHCGGAVVFYDAAFDPETGEVAEDFDCTACGAAVTKGKLERRFERVRTLAGDSILRTEYRPVRIVWSRKDGRQRVTGEKPLDDNDHAVLARVAGLRVAGFPTAPLPLPTMVHGSRLGPKGFSAVHHLYPDRALAALSILWTWAAEEESPATLRALKFWIEQAFWGLSWMNRYQPIQQGKLGGSQVNRQMTGVYYVPSLVSECSVRYNLEGSLPARGKRASLVKLWQSWKPVGDAIRISTGSAASLPVPDESVDYVFVDPPFGGNIPYADLALVVENWHGVMTSVSQEAVVDSFKGKSTDMYGELMTSCFREFHRVLKPGRWMTVEFSNSSNEIWTVIQQALAAAGFVVADTRVLDKEQGSYRQVTATNAVKRDLIISCYKPATEIADAVLSSGGGADGVWAFVREHLRHLPTTDGQRGKARVIRERHPDRIYDRMVAYHVANGLQVPMTVSEFYAGLDAQFVLRDGMYFLPDQAEQYERFRITFRDLEEQQLFVTDENSAVAWLRQLIRRKGRPMTFAEIQPEFMKELQRAAGTWSELPDLKVLLEQNFVRSSSGDAWMIPDPRKAEHLEQLRQVELLKVFASYLEGRSTLTRFRGEAILAGFKHAWAAGNYQQIIDVGSRLPTDALVELPAALHYIRNARKRVGV
jgi:DNA modification methylase